jgi:hypothetical protein
MKVSIYYQAISYPEPRHNLREHVSVLGFRLVYLKSSMCPCSEKEKAERAATIVSSYSLGSVGKAFL